MMLLSLGSEALILLMRHGDGRFSHGPDLSWLLHGPEGETRAAGRMGDRSADRENSPFIQPVK